MDYEEYSVQALAHHKEMKDKTSLQTRTVNRVLKCITEGDIHSIPKLLDSLREAAREREEALCRLEELVTGFDGKQYMADGDFVAQMLAFCTEMGIDAHGSFPSYEMFPCRVTVNPEAQEVVVDRKHFQCLRPLRVVTMIKTELDRLGKAAFNPASFGKEIASAYDLALLKKAKGRNYDPSGPCYLLDLYDLLTPMRRHKREYTRNSFAYDLARLYAAGDLVLDDGRFFRFDTVRGNTKAIRILDQHGTEQYIAAVRLIPSPQAAKEDRSPGTV